MKATLLATTLALLLPAAAGAEERTATLEVTGLYCASCPYIAAQAITSIPSADIVGGYYDPQAQLAHFVVRYDDAKATLDQLIAAPAQYGYPARRIEDEAPANNS
ncbi:MAG: hypothetical protein D6754_05535 [Alphaproteobacteria bacterium]|nr:MAG: hypothetical protein D6754_05535 [Alphaproteobacteria bacterium]